MWQSWVDHMHCLDRCTNTWHIYAVFTAQSIVAGSSVLQHFERSNTFIVDTVEICNGIMFNITWDCNICMVPLCFLFSSTI